jgi:hypothetical protein
MTANPFIRLYEMPVESLTAGAYALVLVAALMATWYGLGRNLLYLHQRWRNGWSLLIPFWYAARVIAILLVAAIDMLLVAGIVGVLT